MCRDLSFFAVGEQSCTFTGDLGKEKIEQTLIAGWALDPVHPSSHVYAKMALNLIEAVAAPKSNSDSKKRKRSDDSGSGSSSQYGAGLRQPRSVRNNESPRSHSLGSGFAASNAGSSYGPGSGYGPGYGSSHTGNRFPNQSYFPQQPRGSAGSVSSRGTMGSFSSTADRGRKNGGYRGGAGGGSGGRGPFRGRPWPRW